MIWQFSPYAVAYLITTGVAGLAAVAAWRRRSIPGGWLLTLLMLAAAEWAFCSGLEVQAMGIPDKIAWSKIQYLGIISVPALWLLFALRYTGQGARLIQNPGWVVVLWIIPLITLAMVFTNEKHGLIWPRVYQPSDSATSLAVYEHGPGFWLHFGYSYVLILSGTLAVLRAVWRCPDLYRRQAGTLAAGAAFPWVGNLIYVLGLGPIPGLDLTPLAFALTGAVMVWGMSRYRLLDLAPIARDVLIENMSDGVLVLDDQNRIRDMNPAMRRYVDPTLASPIGQPVELALTARPDLIAQYVNTQQAQAELCLGKESPRYLDLRLSPLLDRRGRQTGRLLVLRDVTERKQAEAALRDQRALAEALRDTAQALNSTLDLEQVLDRILDNVGRVVSHDAANIMLMDAQHEFARIARAQGYDTDPRQPGKIPSTRVRVNDVPNLRQMAKTGRPLVVPDAQASPDWVQFEGTRWMRSYTGAPICAKGQTIGFLNLNSATPGFFTPAHAESLQAFADQAAVALENARLFAEAQQRAERMALLNDISVAINWMGELNDVLLSAVDGLTRVLGVDQVGIALLDDSRQHLTVMAEHTAQGGRPVTGVEIALADNLSMDHIIRTKSPLAIQDAQNDPLMASVHDLMVQRDVQSILLVPMLIRGEVIGTIGCDATKTPRQFKAEEIDLAQTVANLVALRIEQARLFEAERMARQQAQRRAEDLSGLYAISRAASRSLSINDVLSQALTTALVSLNFEAGHIAVAETDGSDRSAAASLRLVAERGLPADLRRRFGYGFEGTLSAHAHTHKTLVLIDDLKRHQLPDCQAMIDTLAAQGWHSFIGIPLIHQEHSLGVLGLISRQRRLSSTYDLALLNSLGHQIASAAANAQLFQETLNERGRLRALIQSSRDGILLNSLNGQILVINAPALKLLRLPGLPEDWLGSPLQDALDALGETAQVALAGVGDNAGVDYDAGAAYNTDARRLQAGAAPVREGEFEIPPHYIHWMSLPVKVGASPVGRLIVLRNLTEQHAVEKMREDMTRTMVHDLRNPLSGISASLALLTSGAPGSLTADQERFLNIAQRSTQQMMGLVNAILEVSRLESGQMPIEPQAVYLGELVAQVFQAQNSLAAEKELELVSEIPASLPAAWADARLIYRVLQNLVGNAIKFTPTRGTVRVSTRIEPRPRCPLLVSVRDTGAGIPAEIRERLFQKFVAGNQEGRGSGLGLAFCRLALEAHGQRIWIEDTSARGTAITFSLATQQENLS